MDNIDVKPGEGVTVVSVATDDVSGTHYPVYKLATGKDGEAELVTSDNPQPVESLELVEVLREIKELNVDILKQLKTMNAYYCEWDGDQLEE